MVKKFPHSFLKIYIDAFVFMKIIKVNCCQESMINYSEKAKINYIDEYTYKKKIIIVIASLFQT